MSEFEIKPISYLKSHAADMLQFVNETHRPLIITQNGEAKAVLQDPESYNQMRKTLGLLKLISQSELDVKAQNITSQDALFDQIEKKLKSNG